ncbi:MAG: urea ABC transporter ATP-binding subunit UrtE [Burkholderiales bacterium]|nr:urea ABC transporter ATP-binding subunit UrtE [Burkholderiales bacterium]
MLSVDAINVFYGDSHVIHNVAFELGQGETIAIMGRNGMGKTTLLKSLIGWLPTRSGKVKLAGAPMDGAPSYQRVSQGMAFVPQGRMIFPFLTVEENILTGMEHVKEKTVPKWIYETFPVLLEMKHRKGGNLSGGQQQQLAIGRALVTRPRLLVLDEPTEGIQPSIIKDIGRAITYLRGQGDMAIVLVEQYFDFARELADSFAVMDRGEIVLAGTRETLREDEVRGWMTV